MTEFISRKYGNDGYEVIIKTDSHEHYKASEDFARRLIDHAKPITKADRIRAMSDEELAKFLECFGLCHHCTEHHRLGDLRIYADEKCDEMCEQHCLEWLQQPAGE